MRWTRVLLVALLAVLPVLTTGSGVSPRLATAQAGQLPVPVADTVYITKTGDCFHAGHCRHLRKSKIAIERKDAVKRGYRACKVCKP